MYKDGKGKDNHNIYNVSLIEEYICHISISIRFAYYTDIRVFDLINEKKNVNEIQTSDFNSA